MRKIAQEKHAKITKYLKNKDYPVYFKERSEQMSKKPSKAVKEKNADLFFANEHYRRFVLYLDHLRKCTHIIETHFADQFSVKAVHLFWVYELSRFQEGLSSSDLATICNVNRSLISREMPYLIEENIVCYSTEAETKKYNRRLMLTPKGKAMAEQVASIASRFQVEVSCGISPEEMGIFREVMQKLSINFQNILDKKEL